MNIYDFLNNKNENVKITTENFNIVSILKAFNTLQNLNDKATIIIMSPTKFNELIILSKKDIFKQNNIYQKIIENKKIFNTNIKIDNEINENIIKVIGEKETIELFIGKF